MVFLLKPQRQPFLRRLLMWLLGGVLVILTAVSVSRVASLKQQLYERAVTQTEIELNNLVASWETQLITQIEVWLETANPDQTKSVALQAQLRRRRPWLDSLYLWVPPKLIEAGPRTVREPGRFLFPTRPPTENRETILGLPCMATARALTLDSSVNTDDLAKAYVDGCASETLAVRLVAASETASLLSRIGKYAKALRTLDQLGIPENPNLRRALREGVVPNRIALHHLQRAGLLQQVGKLDASLALFNDVGLQITALDAPSAESLVQYVQYPILAELEKHNRLEDAYRLQLALGKTQRRIRAYQEISQRILPTPTPTQLSGSPKMAFDLYNDPPFVLFYQFLNHEAEYGAAVQLDQQILLEDFMQRLEGLSAYAVIEDTEGNIIMGQADPEDITTSVPFPRTLSYLRVGLHKAVIDKQLEGLSDQWLTPLAITLFCLVIGFIALSAQTRANREQQMLLSRQREFTTRVTHELKTPLAGIRLMAENLLTGSFRDGRQAEDMAQRIVNEADRLTDRVEQILSVASSREIPQLKRFDPEEPVMDAIMDWGPRMEANGVEFQADLEITSEVDGDKDSLRDAIACLLDNAIKYRREDVTNSVVTLRLFETEKWVQIEVTDNGIGVPKDKRRVIFDRFARIEGPNRGRAGGHGLGLAQVYDIVSAHNGIVRCMDGLDGGSKFIIQIPKAKP